MRAAILAPRVKVKPGLTDLPEKFFFLFLDVMSNLLAQNFHLGVIAVLTRLHGLDLVCTFKARQIWPAKAFFCAALDNPS